MKLSLFSICLGVLLSFSVVAQTTVLDFEAPETSTTFQYFGSDLDPTLNEIIANPDKSGINTSDSVAIHVKPANSQVWAGCFSNPNPTIPVSVIAGNSVCMKVWFPNTGSVSLKLENGSIANWITTQPVDVANAWTEICFDTNEDSIEDPFTAAAGGIYNTITLFFDFQTAFETEQIYYFDDIIVGEGQANPIDVTFNVDLTGSSPSSVNVIVNGETNAMSDGDGDDIYSYTLTGAQPGNFEYIFEVDGAAEAFEGFFASCLNENGNRFITLSETTVLDPVGFESCFAVGEGVRLTIELGEAGIEVDPAGLFIAGGGTFGNPGDFPLSDEDGDGVHTAVFEFAKGFSSFYTFANGACGDFGCKEQIGGQDCADPDNFNDRFIPSVTQDTTISTCFGQCTTSALECASADNEVTFQVDMNNYTEAFTTAYVSGTFNGWAGDANPLQDDDQDGIWEATLTLTPGPIEFKFQLDQWTVQEEFTAGDPCTIGDVFVNRTFEVAGSATVCFEFNTCTACDATSTNNLDIDHNLFQLSPSMTSSTSLLTLSDDLNEVKTVRVFNASGMLIEQYIMGNTDVQQEIDLSNVAKGLYFVTVQTERKLGTRKLIRQ